MVGRTLGHYEILEPLGAGGMGEVYRARDTKLERDVAIKVLPEDLADDPDRLARLQREAKLLAALNHPNIATVHALEGEQDACFLVLELVQGQSLEQKLVGGPMPVEKALDICRQIAEALEAAHGEGIIHRDLKPANVLVTPDGRAKVLDFGIAKSMQLDAGVAATEQATNLTVAGTLVGTPSYMSPEQVRGGVIDKRVDIWAFGCLLFEMLTGKSAFGRETLADTLSAIVDHDPDWEALPELTPAGIRVLLRRCLKKEAGSRLHDVADARIEIEEGHGEPDSAGAARPRPRRLAWPVGTLAAAALLVASVALWATLGSSGPPVTAMTVRFSERLPEGQLSSRYSESLAFSPDGETLLQVMRGDDTIRVLWVRRLDELEWQPLAGTTGAAWPFFSPDGDWIGFVLDGELRKISVTGGPHFPIAVAPQGDFGASSWRRDDVIVTENQGSLYTVSAAGDEEPVLLAAPATDRGEAAYDLPRHIPGTDAVIFTILRTGGGGAVAVLEPGDEAPRVVVEPAYAGRYLASGHLLYALDNRLFVIPFDTEILDIPDGAVAAPMIDSVYMYPRPVIGPAGATSFLVLAAVSPNGTLALHENAEPDEQEYQPVWYGLDGSRVPLETLPRSDAGALANPLATASVANPRLAPDDRRLVYQKAAAGADGRAVDTIVLHDLETGRNEDVVSGGTNAVWSPDGEWIYYARQGDDGTLDVYRRRADLSGMPEPILEGEGEQQPRAISPDGSWIVYNDTPQLGVAGNRLWIYSITEKGDPHPVVDGDADANHLGAAISADGKWIAWGSNSSGTFEVYVTSFPRPGQRHKVSQGGGMAPIFPYDNATRLFIHSGRGILAVDLDAEGVWSSPRPVFAGFSGGNGKWGVSSDGQRLLAVEGIGETREDTLVRLQFVVGWFSELDELSWRVPGGR